jgi:hypothetical protein
VQYFQASIHASSPVEFISVSTPEYLELFASVPEKNGIIIACSSFPSTLKLK